MAMKLPAATQQALQFEETVLPNGLTVRLLPMPGYGAVHAIYATGFGSIDRHFTQNGATTRLPAGVAHFLEHKMFENENGEDAFALYAKTGASPNAYTGFDRTSYIFTATQQIDENLDILLSFVGHPHFTKETIQKEQGIIGQEIKMYEDYPELRCHYALLECLYHNHPVRDDIAGTVQSIEEITPDMLYACTNAFYNPANMALCAAGDLTMGRLLAAVERAGLPKQAPPPTKRLMAEEPHTIKEKSRRLHMPVAMPLFGVGFKEQPVAGSTTAAEVECDLLCELIAGESSTLYRKLYDEGLVQPGFGGEYGLFAGCRYLLFSGESEKPEEVRRLLLEEIGRQRREGIDPSQFALVKNMMYGEAIQDLENVERVASSLSASHFRRRTPAAELAALAAVTESQLNEALQQMLREEREAFVVVAPSEGEQA